jgi:glyoxylase-like metal-dependent hydrolase (beta-lactamase superfamily II)
MNLAQEAGMRRIVSITIVIAALVACNHEPKSAVLFPEGNNRVITVPLHSSNVYFIKTIKGYLMVDTGMGAGEKAVAELFYSAGIEPTTVALIIVTHVHPDHIGGLSSAKELTGASVLCHKNAAEYIESGKSEPIVGHSAMGSFLAAVTPKKFKGVVPDVVVGDEFDLKDYGVDGRVIHVPGHTSGSITILLDNGETLVGDLVRGEHPELSLGNFYEDRTLLLQNLEKLIEYNSRIIYMSHGNYTNHRTLLEFIEEQKRSSATKEKA